MYEQDEQVENLVLEGLSGSMAGEDEEIVLEGADLGLVKRRGRRNVRVNTTGMSRYMRALTGKLSTFPKDVRQKIAKGQLAVSDKRYFSVKKLSGTSVDLIKTDRPITAGLTNLSQQMIDKSNHFLLLSMKLLYSDETLADDSTAPTQNFDKIPPVELLLALFTLKMANKELISNTPVGMIAPDPVHGYNTGKEFGGFTLNNPKLLEPQTRIEVQIDQAPTTMSGAVYLELIGLELKGK